MFEITELFSATPLPYTYVEIPGPKEPAARRKNPLKYYVNRVITKLSRDAFTHAGFEPTDDFKHWNASWGRQYQQSEYLKCQNWQKINHFAGAFLMGRKDNFHDRMTELKGRIGDKLDFYPESYKVPKQKNDLLNAWNKYKIWIAKPFAQARGKGIHLVDSTVPISFLNETIYQQYIERPFLILHRKFDIRLYVLVSSIAPLRIYIHDSGLIRFGTHQYTEDAPLDDIKAHLTNFSLNQDDENFQRGKLGNENVNNSKWSLPFFIDYLKNQKFDVDAIFKEIERVIISTIIAGVCSIRKYHPTYIKGRQTSYEMYGMDIMLDDNLHPYIMEVNISPAMSGLDSQLDYDIKYRLMLELLQMARIIDCNCMSSDPCPGITAVEQISSRSLTAERLFKVTNRKENPWDNPIFMDFMIIRDFIEELPRKGSFKLIYPVPDTMNSFDQCFDQMKYQDIVFNEWFKLSEAQRKNAIITNWQTYVDGLEDVKHRMAL